MKGQIKETNEVNKMMKKRQNKVKNVELVWILWRDAFFTLDMHMVVCGCEVPRFPCLCLIPNAQKRLDGRVFMWRGARQKMCLRPAACTENERKSERLFLPLRDNKVHRVSSRAQRPSQPVSMSE